jgi:hypothetical protein
LKIGNVVIVKLREKPSTRGDNKTMDREWRLAIRLVLGMAGAGVVAIN